MLRLWRGLAKKQRGAASADFERALTREVLRTEQLRIRTLIATSALLLVALWAIDLIAPRGLEQLWRGQFRAAYLTAIIAAFILFEVSVHAVVGRHLKLSHQDVPRLRRYVSALIETSMPTVALALHMENMGSAQALGFVAPLAYFIFIILSTLRLDFWLSTFTGFVAAAELFGMAVFYHPAIDSGPEPEIFYHAARSTIILICGILAGAVGAQLRRQFVASIQAASARDRVTNLFGQHVSPEVVERLLAEGADVSSDIRRVAVMFVDFRSFTEAARSRSPQEVVDRLDGAFAVLVGILDRHGGIVNKFLGDGFLALFGAPLEAPDAAHRAVTAAREMLTAMDEINRASSWPLQIGIGIHFGEVVAGNIGSPRRKEYTVIGDTVNFAARLESLNKDFNSQLLISAAVRDALGQDGDDAVSLGEVAVRGYDHPMTVWQLG
jgi:adenylate cyclase